MKVLWVLKIKIIKSFRFEMVLLLLLLLLKTGERQGERESDRHRKQTRGNVLQANKRTQAAGCGTSNGQVACVLTQGSGVGPSYSGLLMSKRERQRIFMQGVLGS